MLQQALNAVSLSSISHYCSVQACFNLKAQIKRPL